MFIRSIMNNQKWFYRSSNAAMGPFNATQIHDLYLNEVISSKTLVRNDVMSWWIPLDSSVLFSSEYVSVLKRRKTSRNKSYSGFVGASFLKGIELLVLGIKPVDLVSNNIDTVSKALEKIYKRQLGFTFLCFLFLFAGGIKFFLSAVVSILVSFLISGLFPSINVLNDRQIKLRREENERLALLREEQRKLQLEKERFNREEALRKEQERIRQLAEIEGIHLKVDHTRANYKATNDCYLRNNKLDKLFVKKYRYHLERISRNRCLNCDNMFNLQLDHAIFPKSMGGSFIMVHNSGKMQANCILLCQSCNSSKGQRDYKVFIKDHKRIMLMHAILAEMTVKLNEPMGQVRTYWD